MMELSNKEKIAKSRVCLALDVSTVEEALELVSELKDYVGMFKVGKELHLAAGIEGINIINAIYKKGGSVFLDLKFHDTPNTVYKACKAASVPGVTIMNVHVAGGHEMCKSALVGVLEGARERDIKKPNVIGVTVLTSLDDTDLKVQNLGITYDDLVKQRTKLAKEWKLDGVVCPAKVSGKLCREFGSDFLFVTPGIEWDGKKGDGQKQLFTPDKAVRECASSILVIGSAITKSDDKIKTCKEILKAMASEL